MSTDESIDPRMVEAAQQQIRALVDEIAALSRRLVLNALRDGGEQLTSMGARSWVRAALLLLHERWGVLTVLLVALGRAIRQLKGLWTAGARPGRGFAGRVGAPLAR